MAIEPLLIIEKKKKKKTTQCPLTGKQINKSQQIYTLEHYSAIKMTYSGNKMDESQKHKSDYN